METRRKFSSFFDNMDFNAEEFRPLGEKKKLCRRGYFNDIEKKKSYIGRKLNTLRSQENNFVREETLGKERRVKGRDGGGN